MSLLSPTISGGQLSLNGVRAASVKMRAAAVPQCARVKSSWELIFPDVG